jgi:hypothetical protein
MRATELSDKILNMEFGDVIFIDNKGVETKIDGNPNCYYERIIHGWIYGGVSFMANNNTYVAKKDHFVFIREGK